VLARRPLLIVAVAATLFATSCSSDDGGDASDTTRAGEDTSTSTTQEPAADPAYEERGPNEVGVHTIALDDGRRVVVWYPAADDAADAPSQIFDIASLLSPQLQEQIDAELRPQYEIAAHPGAEAAADGPYPVMLFSHGFSGYPEQSADLVTHLASWGFVVVAPDHVERSLSGLLGTAAQGVEPREDPEVLTASLDAALAEADDDASPIAGLLDVDEVAVGGHSAGASAAYLTASADDRIDAFIAYSVGEGRPDENGDVPERPVPEVPGMVMLGDGDGIIPAESSRAVYEGMDTPKHLVEIAEAGHLVFSDICLIGREQGGLVGLVGAAGLELPDNLLRLASDGCEEDRPAPEGAFGAINHFSVAFLRSSFGIDDEPVGMDQATADTFTTAEVSYQDDLG
jgi:predicted dienelactone hydrolase